MQPHDRARTIRAQWIAIAIALLVIALVLSDPALAAARDFNTARGTHDLALGARAGATFSLPPTR